MEENQVQIPDGWDKYKIIEVCDILDNLRRPLNKLQREKMKGNIPYYGANNIQDYINDYIFNEPLILIAEDGGNFEEYETRPIAQKIAGKSWVNNHTHVLRVKSSYSHEFIFYNVVNKNILEFIKGGTRAKLNKRELEEIPLLMPTSQSEQTQIASILSKVDEGIAQTEQLIAKYTRIKTGLMQDLLTKGIDEQGNIRNEETHEFKDSPLGRIPKEWEVKKMGDLILAIDPQPDHRTPAAIENGVPYVGISDILNNGEIDLKSCRKVGLNVLEKQQGAFKVAEGDIIFGKIGTIGKPKVLPSFSNYQFTLSANIILIKPHECPDFIYWSLVSKYVEDQVNLDIHSTSQPAFGMQKIRDLNILTPLPEERNRITEKLRKLNVVVSLENAKLTKLQSIKTGLMQDLLSGKVSVNHLIKETMKA